MKILNQYAYAGQNDWKIIKTISGNYINNLEFYIFKKLSKFKASKSFLFEGK